MPNTREKLIELLKEASHLYWLDRLNYDYYGFVAEYLISNGIRLEEKQATSDESKWIPVTVKPKENGQYLAFKQNHYGAWYEVLSFAKDGRKVDKYDFHSKWENVWYYYDSEFGYCVSNLVTHWMPLPEPPVVKKGKDDGQVSV